MYSHGSGGFSGIFGYWDLVYLLVSNRGIYTF
jgi:hypothetical protein